ncbi:uncharacterized protein LOC128891985 [Hylaeus anthracinus]|uniref:uncharacterized protein LOC128891985 n=1 Tax=Hylaeus anthracinus TaxID=313031 RepID=UPI0023B9ED54|nr:uncharacterized protein LOC128891985 [Hylaeus anthracinus]
MKKTRLNSKLHVHKLVPSLFKDHASRKSTNGKRNFPDNVTNSLESSESLIENYTQIESSSHLNILKISTETKLPELDVNIPDRRHRCSKSKHLKVSRDRGNSVKKDFDESAVCLYENQSSKFVVILVKQV